MNIINVNGNRSLTAEVNVELDSLYSHSHAVATEYENGFMSASDKEKLNRIEENANKTVIDCELSKTSTNPVQNKVISDNLNAVMGRLNEISQTLETIDAFGFVDLYDGWAIDNNNEFVKHGDFGYTDYIEVPLWANKFMFFNCVTTGGKLYALSDFEYATYDADKTFIGTIHGDTEKTYVVKDINPNVVRYIRLNYGKHEKNNGFCVAKFMYVINNSIDISGILRAKWDNTTGDFLGDSLIEQGKFLSKMSTLFNITVNNYGKSGTTISNINSNMYYSSRIDGMSVDCDFIFVLGGTNDWGLGVTLGEKTDTSLSTFYGGLYTMFEALRAKFPTKPIFVSTILQRDWSATSEQSSGIDSNANGDSIEMFNDAIRYMANRYGCVVVDAYRESGIIVNNLSAYTSDNLHFNDAGAERYAKFVKDKMETVTPY